MEEKVSERGSAVEEAGVRFQAIVSDMQGGMTRKARVNIHVIAQPVASAENRDVARIKAEAGEDSSTVLV